VGKDSAGESWVVVPNAADWDALVPAVADGDAAAPRIHLMSADVVSHPAVRHLVSVFGQPAPLDEVGWERVRCLRSALGDPVSELEFQVASRVATGSGRGETALGAYVETILRECRPRLLVTVVGSGELEEGLTAGVAAELEKLAQELWPSLSSGNEWLAIVSPGGRPSRGGVPGSGFVLAAGGPFRSGRVLAGPHSLVAVQASLSRALLWPRSKPELGIPAMFRR
jgi:hypothetical protein